ncbi:type II toxin-antitoxin system VapC family toxin [Rubrivirga sp.]|uniref:type II toxin-antitoxin system VapC family toxin n=1 Tax=Rubrivirga sp. TaxID=1885344 RepID=UPI003B51739A
MPSRSPLFVDTAYVLALVSRQDQFHPMAVALSLRFEGSPLVTTNAVLFEIGNSLSRSHRAEAAAIIRLFRSSENVTVLSTDARRFKDALALYASHSDKTWGLVDCLSFVVMREEDLNDALTTDAHFEQAGFHVLMRESAL